MATALAGPIAVTHSAEVVRALFDLVDVEGVGEVSKKQFRSFVKAAGDKGECNRATLQL